MNYSKLLRKMRQQIFDYEDKGLGEKASRILEKVKKRHMASPEVRKQMVLAKQNMDERIFRLG